MGIKKILLSELEADPKGTLDECCDSGRSLVVEMPDHRLLSIQTLEPGDDDRLLDELLAADPSFRAIVERSKSSPHKPFPCGS
jgi:hypothetical protein